VYKDQSDTIRSTQSNNCPLSCPSPSNNNSSTRCTNTSCPSESVSPCRRKTKALTAVFAIVEPILIKLHIHPAHWNDQCPTPIRSSFEHSHLCLGRTDATCKMILSDLVHSLPVHIRHHALFHHIDETLTHLPCDIRWELGHIA